MSSSTKAEIILVPGAWHGPESFGPTTAILKKAGYTIHGIDLAASAGPPHITSIQPDVDLIRAATEKVLSQGKDVVHVYHSYGSVPGMESLKEYLTEEKKEGWGRVRRLVFVCAFVLDVDGSLMKALGGNDLPWFQVSVSSPEYFLFLPVCTREPDQLTINIGRQATRDSRQPTRYLLQRPHILWVCTI